MSDSKKKPRFRDVASERIDSFLSAYSDMSEKRRARKDARREEDIKGRDIYYFIWQDKGKKRVSAKYIGRE